MKSQVVCQLLSFIGIHREGILPERDLIFLATADEEASGKLGAEYMLEKVEELRHASFVLSEGGSILEEAGVWHAQVSVAEKKVCQFMLRAGGTGGHGSMPHGDNANDKILRAANRIISTRLPLKPTKLVTRYMNGLLQGRKIAGMRFSNLKDALRNIRFRAFVEHDPLLNAMLRNTVTATMLKSGDKVNVIPTEATACFDARILPEESHEGFLGRMRKIAGPEVELLLTNRTDSAASPHDTPYFRRICGGGTEDQGRYPRPAHSHHRRDRPSPLPESRHPRIRLFSDCAPEGRGDEDARIEREALCRQPDGGLEGNRADRAGDSILCPSGVASRAAGSFRAWRGCRGVSGSSHTRKVCSGPDDTPASAPSIENLSGRKEKDVTYFTCEESTPLFSKN